MATPQYCKRVSSEEAMKISQQKTDEELQKLYQTIDEQNNKIESVSDNFSDSDSSCNSNTHLNVGYKSHSRMPMETLMYIDNQKMWKKYQQLQKEVSKKDEKIRYLQLEVNNKNIDITKYKSTLVKYKETSQVISALQKHLVVLYFICTIFIMEKCLNTEIALPALMYVINVFYIFTSSCIQSMFT